MPSDILTSPVRPHPIVHATIFAALTESEGGATMHARTGEFSVSPGGTGYGVGGVRGTRSHKRIPTWYSDPVAGGRGPALNDVLTQWQRVKHMASGLQDANVGSWAQDDQIEWDASQVIADREQAIAKGRARGEKAIHDYHEGKDIYL